MSPTQLEDLVQLVGGDIYKMTFLRETIPVRQRLVLTLRFLASGDSMSSLSTHYLIGNATVCNIIREVNCAIWKNLRLIVFKKLTKEDWRKISIDFHNKTYCVHCLGAINGKHVNIQCPPNAGSAYYNFKGFHSIVLLAICNANYEFTYIDVGSYGRRSDGGVFADSSFAKSLLEGTLDIPPPEEVIEGGPPFPYCFVADEAFPLSKNVLRPYSGKVNCTLEKRVFNYRMGWPRRMVENSFGILVSRWRIFRKPILMDPVYVIRMVKATVCLHNWLRKSDEDYIPHGLVDRDCGNGEMIPGTWRDENRNRVTAFQNMLENDCNPNRIGIAVREMFCQLYNTSYALPWQYNYV
ncbi:hypothetical protein QAD02_006735 [Eretmocerus hayati]|uniref:Uncharacterized protein n=1 Tax=Eretmocerus hayati TaxID=131215 RepID=A0ACC2N2V4_9HYME|nr:hypothetical protein QAD02_006735 [Eretmocerus hayati]